MRTLVDIAEPQIKALDGLARKDKLSRAALIRKAIDDYLEKRIRDSKADAFGLWGKGKIDGLDYQEKVRGEW